MKWLFVLIPFVLFALDSRIEAEEVSLHESTFQLDGHVKLTSEMGVLQAQHAKVQQNRQHTLTAAFLSGDVKLNLPRDSTLICDSAEINFSTRMGALTGKHRGVIYRDHITVGRSVSPLEIACNRVNFKMSDEPACDIEHLNARESVVIKYADRFSVYADHAIYRKLDAHPSRQFDLPQGMIKLYPKNRKEFCLLKHESDTVQAQNITIDTKKGQIAMVNASGSLGPKNRNSTQFQAGNLIWDHKISALFLSDEVHFDDSEFGTLEAKEQLRIDQREFDGHYSISCLTATGPLSLTHKDSSGAVHTFYCTGTTVLDKDRSTIITEAYGDETFVEYTHGPFAISAHQSRLAYLVNGTHPVLSQIDFEGQVCITLNSQEGQTIAVADSLTYFPQISKVILQAAPGRQVLFSRAHDTMRLAAEELILTGNHESPHIEGIGRVQAFFNQDQTNYYRQIFKKRRAFHEAFTPSL